MTDYYGWLLFCWKFLSSLYLLCFSWKYYCWRGSFAILSPTQTLWYLWHCMSTRKKLINRSIWILKVQFLLQIEATLSSDINELKSDLQCNFMITKSSENFSNFYYYPVYLENNFYSGLYLFQCRLIFLYSEETQTGHPGGHKASALKNDLRFKKDFQRALKPSCSHYIIFVLLSGILQEISVLNN